MVRQLPGHPLTVLTCCPFEAQAVVSIVSILAGPSILARLALALIHVDVTAVASVTWLAEASEGGNAILAGSIVTGVWVTFINISFTAGISKTWGRKDSKRQEDTV